MCQYSPHFTVTPCHILSKNYHQTCHSTHSSPQQLMWQLFNDYLIDQYLFKLLIEVCVMGGRGYGKGILTFLQIDCELLAVMIYTGNIFPVYYIYICTGQWTTKMSIFVKPLYLKNSLDDSFIVLVYCQTHRCTCWPSNKTSPSICHYLVFFILVKGVFTEGTTKGLCLKNL